MYLIDILKPIQKDTLIAKSGVYSKGYSISKERYALCNHLRQNRRLVLIHLIDDLTLIIKEAGIRIEGVHHTGISYIKKAENVGYI